LDRIYRAAYRSYDEAAMRFGLGEEIVLSIDQMR
jgi:hypothetical protein